MRDDDDTLPEADEDEPCDAVFDATSDYEDWLRCPLHSNGGCGRCSYCERDE